ncbi:MAG: cell division protein FtsZ [Arcicella sp.]|nr:cell division protein FtsZ [Arcicella sp.]
MAFYEHDIEIPSEKKNNIIKVIGVGGGGSNAVEHMYITKIQDVDFVVCNTDLQALNDNKVPTKLQLGAILTEGLGAGTEPEQGRLAALESEAQIKALLQPETKMVFITAGMGGGTGTGAAPEIARIAKELDILTVAIVTAPYSWEGTDKIDAANAGIKILQEICDTVLVILNDKLLEIFEDLNILEAFEHADDVLANAAKSVAEVITKSGKVNADFKDVKKVLKNAGQAVMSQATAQGINRAKEVIEQALDSPLLNNQSIKGAQRILVTVSTSKENIMGVKEQSTITTHIIEAIGGPPQGFKLGFTIEEGLGDKMNITVIAAGFDKKHLKLDTLNGVKIEVAKERQAVDTMENEEEEQEEDVKEEAKPIQPIIFTHREDDTLRLRKMIDAFCQKLPTEEELETPAFQRYGIKLLDVSEIKGVEFQRHSL